MSTITIIDRLAGATTTSPAETVSALLCTKCGKEPRRGRRERLCFECAGYRYCWTCGTGRALPPGKSETDGRCQACWDEHLRLERERRIARDAEERAKQEQWALQNEERLGPVLVQKMVKESAYITARWKAAVNGSINRFSPEAARFTALKIEQFMAELQTVKAKLDVRGQS